MPRRDPEKNREYQKKWYRKNKSLQIERNKANRNVKADWFWDYKTKLSCKCGENHPATLDFHHRDSTLKDANISEMMDCSIEKILEEIAKCEVMCANCHRKLHFAKRGH
jgi:hypothetical protein